MSTNNQSGKANVPKTRAPGVPAARNPPQRPNNPARQQPGSVELGHNANFSKSPGSRESGGAQPGVIQADAGDMPPPTDR
jgi:hypothetical protein